MRLRINQGLIQWTSAICLVALLFLAAAVPARAQEWEKLVPEYLEAEQYSESWFFYFQFDNGYHLFSTVLVTNLGPGERKPAFNCTVVTPEGQATLYEGRHEPEELAVAAAPFRLAMGRSYLAAEGRALHYHIEESGVVADLLLETGGNGYWTPRRYQYPGGEGKYLEVAIPIPRGKASGSIAARGKSAAVSGIGYFEHNRSNVTQILQARAVSRLISWRDGMTAAALLIETKSGPLAFQGCFPAAGAPAFSTPKLHRETAAGAELPIWTYSSSCGGSEEKLQAEKLLQYSDMFSHLSFVERTVVRAFAGRAESWRYQLRSPANRGMMEIIAIK